MWGYKVTTTTLNEDSRSKASSAQGKFVKDARIGVLGNCCSRIQTVVHSQNSVADVNSFVDVA